MADVRKERGLRAIDLRQCLRPPAFGLISARRTQAGGALRRHEFDESRIGLSQRAVRIQTGDKQPGWMCLALLGDRHGHEIARRAVPCAVRQSRKAAHVVNAAGLLPA
ncbi:hypothetical protein GALL_339120 [mine drainage metagenome]|uniref:Uncharacterized protein n=1 Tax=mine drainage metagenome TaxID=410659 RepID=A0A1J5R3I8_9ZZZZ